jgi:4-hydroxy-4-methyl-2-oxoglutarate aldolase
MSREEEQLRRAGVMNPELIQLLEAGTAAISDIFDAMDQIPLVVDNSLIFVGEGSCRFAGPAYTIKGESFCWSQGGDRAKLEAIDLMPKGVVAVWAGTDIRGVCCFGDLLATAMKARGIAGAIVDGGVRDTSFLKTLGLPVMARYKTPAQAIGRWHVISRQVAIQVRGALEDWITIKPGDIIVADEDGVVVVPQGSLDHVLKRITVLSKEESDARRDIRDGLPLLEALQKYGHL